MEFFLGQLETIPNQNWLFLLPCQHPNLSKVLQADAVMAQYALADSTSLELILVNSSFNIHCKPQCVCEIPPNLNKRQIGSNYSFRAISSSDTCHVYMQRTSHLGKSSQPCKSKSVVNQVNLVWCRKTNKLFSTHLVSSHLLELLSSPSILQLL